MTIVICPKCGTENPGDAVNCSNCRIILKMALEQAEKLEPIESNQGEENHTSSDIDASLIVQEKQEPNKPSLVIQFLLGFFGWLICIIIFSFVQIGTINQNTLRIIWFDVVSGIIPGIIGGVIGWLSLNGTGRKES
jgi:hypothetical protein